MQRHHLAAALLLAASLAGSAAHSQTAALPYQNASLATEQRVDDLVSRMTLEEKVSQMMNTAPAIPRLGVPAYDWWNEGLHGVARSGYATTFPQAIGMAATWDVPLIHRIGNTISTEARAKNNDALRHDNHSIYYGLTFWSPNINIFRDPRWGRGQETYGEDPFLTSRLGVAFVQGLQGDNPKYFKVVATPKHYAVHSGPESERHRFNVDPSPHDLWDTYLPAFRATVTEGRADSVMCAYNAIDKSPACASKELLQTILRDTWHFNGYVTSDCGAVDDFFEKNAHRTSKDAETASVAAVRAGTDTNCGNTYRALTGAVKNKLIQESELDVSLKRLFTARFRLGLFDPAKDVPYAALPMSEVNSPAHQALALEAANKAIVLLKNDGATLPLKPGTRTIAVIGPNAASLSAIEGNYHAIPQHPVFPVDGVAAEFRSAKILYAQGSPYAADLPLPVPRTMLHPTLTSVAEGLQGEYFPTDDLSGKAALTRTDKQIDFDWSEESPAPGIPAEHFSVRWSGTITAPEPGDLRFRMRLADCYPCRDRENFAVFFDGKAVSNLDAPAVGESRPRETSPFTLSFPDTRPHTIRIEYRHNAPLFGSGIALEWFPAPGYLQKEAVAQAQKSDVVLAFVGLTPDLEGEEMPVHVQGFSGGDRTDIKLPAPQQELLEALAVTGKPLVVVLLNGSALSVTWAQQHAAAILEAWYPGQAGGTSIAQTLSGKNNPGGRLPVTFYANLDQLPPFEDYSMANRTYRYFKGKPLFGFGFGLSYTTFAYSGLKLSTPSLHAGDPLTVEADVKNTGSRAGDEVAELYLTPPHTDLSPNLYLGAFTRVRLAPGQSQHISFTLDSRTLSTVDAGGNRSVLPGDYTLTLAGAQPAEAKNAQTTRFTVQGTAGVPR